MKRSIAELRVAAERRREREFRGSAKFKLQQWMAVEVILRAIHHSGNATRFEMEVLAALTREDLEDLDRQRWPRHVIRYGLRQGRHRVDGRVNTGA